MKSLIMMMALCVPDLIQLIEELAHDDYRMRDRAEESIRAVRVTAKPELLAAVKDKDPERRLRAEALLRDVIIEEIWNPPPIELPAQHAKAGDAFAKLAELSGNRIQLGSSYYQFGDFNSKAITLTKTKGGFWELLDHICDVSGNALVPYEQDFTIAEGSRKKNPTATTGPIRVKIAKVKRDFDETIDYDTAKVEKTHTMRFELMVNWEPTFKMLAYHSAFTLEKSLTDSQEPVKQSGVPSNWNFVNGTKSFSIPLAISPITVKSKTIPELNLSLRVFAMGDLARMEEPLETGKQFYKDDMEVTVESIEKEPAAIQNSVRRTYTIAYCRNRNLSEVAQLASTIKIELLNAKGEILQSRQTEKKLDDGRPAISLVVDDTSAVKFQLTYPRVFTERVVKFVFKDINLPSTPLE